MGHDHNAVFGLVDAIEAQPDHAAKKATLFAGINDMIRMSIEDARAKGATDEQLSHFVETMKLFDAHKARLLLTNLL